jgi:pimeloyl-[acyl-carrier protein] methyl ester esterase
MRALLLPGLDGTGELFGPLAEALAALGIESRALRYPVDECLSYDSLVGRVLSELPPAPYVLVGESFSGPIALRVARARPQGLKGVVLAASFIKRPVPRLVGPFARLAFSLPAPGFGLRWVLAGGDAPPSVVAKLQRALQQVPGRVLAYRLRQILDLDAGEDLVACPVPLLYLAGSRDRLVSPRIGPRLQRRRSDLHLVTLPSPHLVLQRQAKAAAEAIAEFAKEASRG